MARGGCEPRLVGRVRAVAGGEERAVVTAGDAAVRAMCTMVGPDSGGRLFSSPCPTHPSHRLLWRLLPAIGPLYNQAPSLLLHSGVFLREAYFFQKFFVLCALATNHRHRGMAQTT